MRIDAYTHFIPKKFFETVENILLFLVCLLTARQLLARLFHFLASPTQRAAGSLGSQPRQFLEPLFCLLLQVLLFLSQFFQRVLGGFQDGAGLTPGTID